MCIVTAYICDGFADCYDKSDENDCIIPVTSSVNETGFMNTSQCVGLYYLCPSGECIPIDRRCDQNFDCQDGSDEVFCPSITKHPYDTVYGSKYQGISIAKVYCYKCLIIYTGRSNILVHFHLKISLLTFYPNKCLKLNFQSYWFSKELRDDDSLICSYILRYDFHLLILIIQAIKGKCPADWSLCEPSFNDCYLTYRRCNHETYKGFPLHCPRLQHLQHCDKYLCPHMYKCHLTYCIPTRMLCDGNPDCANSEDEESCDHHASQCVGLLRCHKDNVCVHPTEVCDGIVHCLLSGDDEMLCGFRPCPLQCRCRGTTVQCIMLISIYSLNSKLTAIYLMQSFISPTESLGYFSNILYLKLDSCKFSANRVERAIFSDISNILILIIINSGVTSLKYDSFDKMIRLIRIDLHGNAIYEIQSFNFKGLKSIINFDLSNYQIKKLNGWSFYGMTRLLHLNLSYNMINMIKQATFFGLNKIKDIDLTGNDIQFIGRWLMPSQVLITVQLYVDKPEFYCAFNNDFNNQVDKAQHCPTTSKSTSLHAINIVISGSMLIGTFLLFLLGTKRNKFQSQYTILNHVGLANALNTARLIANSIIMIIYTNQNEIIYLNTLWLNSFGCSLLNIASFTGFVLRPWFMFVLVFDQFIAIKYSFTKHYWLTYLHRCLFGSWVSVIVVAVVQEHFIQSSSAECLPYLFTHTQESGRMGVTIIVTSLTAILVTAIPLMYYKIIEHVKASNVLVRNSNTNSNQRLILQKCIFISFVAISAWFSVFIVIICSYLQIFKRFYKYNSIMSDFATHITECLDVMFYFHKLI